MSDSSGIFQDLLPLIIVQFLLATYLVAHYASPGTSIAIRALATLSFGLGFGGISLLPVDLRLSSRIVEEGGVDGDSDDGVVGVGGSENAFVDDMDSPNSTNNKPFSSVNETYLPWQITYFSTFFLAWLILPTIRESLLSGQFKFTTQIRDGIRKVLRGHLILLSALLIAIAALAIKMGTWHVVPVLMALGNTYGLVLISGLLGYGLVDLPRGIWRAGRGEGELRRARIMVGAADEGLFESVWNLQDCEEAIDSALDAINLPTNNTTHEEAFYAKCVENLKYLRDSTAQLSPELQSRRASRHGRRRDSDNGSNNTTGGGRGRKRVMCVDAERGDGGEEGVLDSGNPSIDELAALKARLKAAQAQVVSADQRWQALVDRNRWLADLEDLRNRDGSTETSIWAKIRFLWVRCFRGPVYRFLAFLAAGLSVAVLWSEATLALRWNLSPFALFLGILEGDGREKGIVFQVVALIPLLYMSACVYGSLFKLSAFGPYRLSGRQQSDGVALVFNAQYLVRLQFPLGYNYLLMLKYDISSSTCAFSKVMSNMATVPFFGTSFSVYAPLLIIFLCCFTLCNVYARLCHIVGLEHEDAILMGDRETLDGKVNEGIALLRRHEQRTRVCDDGVDDLKLEEEVSGGGGGGWRRGIV